MCPWEPSYSTAAGPEFYNISGTLKKALKSTMYGQIIEVCTEKMNTSFNEIQGSTNKNKWWK